MISFAWWWLLIGAGGLLVLGWVGYAIVLWLGLSGKLGWWD